MANISKMKRERMLNFLNKLKEENKTNDEMLIALGEIETELTSKKYGLVWEEHEEEVDKKMVDNIPVFVEDLGKEIILNPNDKCNFLIEGDNLHSLYLLEKTHKNKIDFIYIDPPYNTNNKEFIYDDKRIDYNDGYRHSKWLSFMSIRLKIAHELLSKSGVIFISIDENEFAQLKILCDDIFGESNFIGTLIWRKKTGGGQTDDFFVTEHEYIFGYRKTTNFKWLEFVEKSNVKDFKLIDDIGNYSITKLEKWGSSAHREDRPTMYYPLLNPDGIEMYPIAPDGLPGRWRVGKNRMEQLINSNGIHWIKDEKSKKWVPYEKNYYENAKGKLLKSRSILYNIAETGTATKLLTSIFGKKDAFPNPKPIEVIQFLLEHTKSNTVLDFFAGSGTTAQAVLELNKTDGGNRQFILCTNNENNICKDVTYPRCQTIITGNRIDGSKYSDPIFTNLKYYKTSFISKNEEMLSNALLEHIKEMVQLEHMVKIDGKNYILLLDDEQADDLEKNWNTYDNLKGIYISKNVLLTSSQNELFNTIEMKVIPDYYFNFELREVGETW